MSNISQKSICQDKEMTPLAVIANECALHRISLLLPLLVLLAVGGCATRDPANGICPPLMLEGKQDAPVYDGGNWSFPAKFNLITSVEPDVYPEPKNAGCYEANWMMGVRSAAFDIKRLHDPIDGLAKAIASRTGEKLEHIIILRVGRGDSTKVVTLAVVLTQIPITTSREPATVVIYTTTDHWNGPAPEDQPWVKVEE